MKFESIIEFAKFHSKEVIEEYKTKEAIQFMARVNADNFNAEKELLEFKVSDRAYSIAQNIIETIIDRLEKGE